MKQPPAMSDEPVTSDPSITRRKRQKSESPESSGVSVQINTSMNKPPEFKKCKSETDLNHKTRERRLQLRSAFETKWPQPKE
ncbi:hypothetical protein G5714_000136 [Onychostoma macrolepis]|uniref:Uncharacterized protein n=1 Tax=Onychostoma macrolepis TaxID=369639 RepID=A0A7J6DGH4_9TELE|nr:hypothetical protein G5714_000136 [Onychostoma macrolepis]